MSQLSRTGQFMIDKTRHKHSLHKDHSIQTKIGGLLTSPNNFFEVGLCQKEGKGVEHEILIAEETQRTSSEKLRG